MIMKTRSNPLTSELLNTGCQHTFAGPLPHSPFSPCSRIVASLSKEYAAVSDVPPRCASQPTQGIDDEQKLFLVQVVFLDALHRNDIEHEQYHKIGVFKERSDLWDLQADHQLVDHPCVRMPYR
jgi:hypothetical protein